MPQFVAEGKEARLGILKQYPFDAPEVFTAGGKEIRNDIRDIVIHRMKGTR